VTEFDGQVSFPAKCAHPMARIDRTRAVGIRRRCVTTTLTGLRFFAISKGALDRLTVTRHSLTFGGKSGDGGFQQIHSIDKTGAPVGGGLACGRIAKVRFSVLAPRSGESANGQIQTRSWALRRAPWQAQALSGKERGRGRSCVSGQVTTAPGSPARAGSDQVASGGRAAAWPRQAASGVRSNVSHCSHAEPE
jgi:hypothetical protein